MDTKTNALGNTTGRDADHPSSLPASQVLPYLHQAAALINLEIPPDYLPGVLANLERTQAIAQLFIDFPLLATTEAAPTFEP